MEVKALKAELELRNQVVVKVRESAFENEESRNRFQSSQHSTISDDEQVLDEIQQKEQAVDLEEFENFRLRHLEVVEEIRSRVRQGL